MFNCSVTSRSGIMSVIAVGLVLLIFVHHFLHANAIICITDDEYTDEMYFVWFMLRFILFVLNHASD